MRLLAPNGTLLDQHRVSVAQLLPTQRRNMIVEVDLEPSQANVAQVEASVADLPIWRPVTAVSLPAVQLSPPISNSIFENVPGLGAVSASLVEGCGVMNPTAEATITNPLDAYPDLVVAAVAFDRQGRIIGGGQRTVVFGPRESKGVGVGLAVRTDLTGIARLEVTAAYSWIDLAPYQR